MKVNFEFLILNYEFWNFSAEFRLKKEIHLTLG